MRALVAQAQERVRESRAELRALTGGSRQLYGAMAFGAGGAGLGAALAGVPGAVVGALVGSIAGQIALRDPHVAGASVLGDVDHRHRVEPVQREGDEVLRGQVAGVEARRQKPQRAEA